jgi:hypothetical protein
LLSLPVFARLPGAAARVPRIIAKLEAVSEMTPTARRSVRGWSAWAVASRSAGCLIDGAGTTEVQAVRVVDAELL